MLLGAVLGLASFIPIAVLWHRSLPWLEQYYLPQYVGSELAQTPIGTVVSFWNGRRTTRRYFVLMQSGRPVTNTQTFNPSQPVSMRWVETTPRIFHLWLRAQIYGGRSLRESLETPLALWYAIVVVLFFGGVLVDYRRRQRAREGVTLRGPDRMRRCRFNRLTKGDGFTLHVEE
jgi:hypothetical protein